MNAHNYSNHFKKYLFLVTFFLSLGSAAQKRGKATNGGKYPNVVFILADDLGYGDLGCYGQEKIETPNIDRLAAGGMKFTQFYAGTSVCAPSRASLLTGLHTGHTAVRGNLEIEPEGQLPIPDSAFTMAELFKEKGYTTGAFGKWGLGYPGSEGVPEKQGFDQFYGYNCQRQSHNYFPDHLWKNDQRINLSNTLTHQVQYAPDLIQQQALSFVEANQHNPFFLYLAYTLPHAGLQLPEGDKVFEAYKKKFNEQPKKVSQTWNGVGYQPQAYPHAAYAAMVTKLDEYVGEVVARLKSLGLDKNTLIVFTSDNGPHREGGNTPEFFDSNADLKGIKRDLTEGGIRVPMIAYWPTKIKANKVVDQAGAFWDFMPTFSQLIKEPLPVKTDGISLVPTLQSKSKRKQKQHDYLYWEFHEDGGRQAVRMGNWKAVREGVMKNPGGPIALYDLSTDPSEKNNVAAQHPEVVEQMKTIMQEAHVENKSFPFIKKSF
ncbi:MAG: arylsulfatase [Chitinophagaceae bacterium]